MSGTVSSLSKDEWLRMVNKSKKQFWLYLAVITVFGFFFLIVGALVGEIISYTDRPIWWKIILAFPLPLIGTGLIAVVFTKMMDKIGAKNVEFERMAADAAGAVLFQIFIHLEDNKRLKNFLKELWKLTY